MSDRGLRLLVIFLGIVLVVATGLAVHRLGYLRTDDAPVAWRFENAMLDAAPGRWVLLRSSLPGSGLERHAVGPTVAEPDEDAPYPAPFLVTYLTRREPDGVDWEYAGTQTFGLNQLGTLSNKEWLEEIRPVRQKGRDGSTRTLLCAVFGHESGGAYFYYYAPGEPVPAFGWIRHERRSQNAPPIVIFAEEIDSPITKEDLERAEAAEAEDAGEPEESEEE